MAFVTLLTADPMGSMISEYSDRIELAMLLGSADIRTSSAFVGVGSSTTDAGSDPESAPTWPIAVKRFPSPSSVVVAPVMFAGSESWFMVVLSRVELWKGCALTA